MNQKTILIYKTPDGKEPFINWLESIKDKQTKNRILARLDRVQLGNPGDHKHIDQGVWELRLSFGSGYRIYYGERDNVILLLLTGGDKSSQETDINKAINYFNEYKERNK